MAISVTYGMILWTICRATRQQYTSKHLYVCAHSHCVMRISTSFSCILLGVPRLPTPPLKYKSDIIP